MSKKKRSTPAKKIVTAVSKSNGEKYVFHNLEKQFKKVSEVDLRDPAYDNSLVPIATFVFKQQADLKDLLIEDAVI